MEGSPSVVFSSVYFAMTGSIIGKCLSARDPLHTGSVHKMDGFLHIYLSLCFLKTAAASCDPGAEILFSADALFSTVTLAKPVVTHPSRTIRAITFGRSTLLHRTFLFFLSAPLQVPEPQACRTAVRWDQGVFPGFGSVSCSHSSSYVRFSGVNLLRCMYSRSHTDTANRFSVSLKSSLFQLPRDFRIVFRSYIFSFKKAVHDIMCIMSWTACLRRSFIVLIWNFHTFYAF